MIIINDTLGAYGGGQTLILRMCTYLRMKNICTGVLCHDDGNDEIVSDLRNIDVIIKCAKSWETDKVERAINFFAKIESELLVINFAWDQYLNIELIKRRNNINIKNIIYCIHPTTFEKGSRIKNRVISNLLKRIYKKILKKMQDNRAIIFDTEIDRSRTEEFFGICLNDSPVLRIPILVKENNNYIDIIEKGFKNNIILTASRAEIPFKGYMLGLIDDFSRLCESNENYKLEIISAGDDIDQITSKIDSLSKHIKERISVYGWMNYEELENEIKNSKLVVGMGTTILDAAKNYKVCIPVVMYTTDNNAAGYFGKSNLYFSAPDGWKESAYPLLEEMTKWNLEQYTSRCMESFETVKENYGIENVMKKMLNTKTVSDSCCLSFFDCLIHKFGNFIRKRRYDGKMNFDYRKIQKYSSNL